MRVVYFAWLRERIGAGEEILEFPASVTTVADAISHLSKLDEAHEHAFSEPKAIRAALDKQVAEHDDPIGAAAEIAFFPPMTGG